MMRIRAGSLTDIGRMREENQDHLGDFEPDGAAKRLGRLAIVADGVGGHRGGGLASRMAIEEVGAAYYADDPPRKSPGEGAPTIGQRLLRSFHEANRRVYLRSLEDSSVRGMASTCTALVLHGDRAFVAHVGDSRAYLIRGASVRRLTRDHSVLQSRIDAGLLTPEQAKTHVDRNIITRCIGFEPEVEPELLQPPVAVQAADHFVLSTDGLHGLLSDAEIAGIVVAAEPEEACRRLVAEANARGGQDNITVQILRIDED